MVRTGKRLGKTRLPAAIGVHLARQPRITDGHKTVPAPCNLAQAAPDGPGRPSISGPGLV